MKHIIFLFTLFLFSCGSPVVDNPQEFELDLRSACIELEEGQNICNYFPCQMPGAWRAEPSRTYFDLALNILDHNPSMKQDGKIVTMTLGGATCGYANLSATWCEYYGVSTVHNKHTLATAQPTNPHILAPDGTIMEVLGDCVNEGSESISAASMAANRYGLVLAEFSKGRREYSPGAIKFRVEQDGYSFAPRDIQKLTP